MQLGPCLRSIWVLSNGCGGAGWDKGLARKSNNSIFWLLTFWSFFIKPFVCTVTSHSCSHMLDCHLRKDGSSLMVGMILTTIYAEFTYPSFCIFWTMFSVFFVQILPILTNLFTELTMSVSLFSRWCKIAEGNQGSVDRISTFSLFSSMIRR